MLTPVLQWKEDFSMLFLLLSRIGFRELHASEYKSRNVIPPRRIKGREKGYIFEANGMDVIVWTTYDLIAQAPRDKGKDLCWVIIREHGKAQHFAKPIRRTKNFVTNVYWRARTCAERIFNRPKDSLGDFMVIKRGRYMFQRYWESPTKVTDASTNKPEREGFDHGVSSQSMAYVKKIRKRTRKYNSKLRAANKKPGAAALIRTPWEIIVPMKLVS